MFIARVLWDNYPDADLLGFGADAILDQPIRQVVEAIPEDGVGDTLFEFLLRESESAGVVNTKTGVISLPACVKAVWDAIDQLQEVRKALQKLPPDVELR